MADNSIVQTIKDAEIDARSLSEFIYKPIDFVVDRRLAPPVRTLDYYIDYMLKSLKNIGYVIVGSFAEGGVIADANSVIADSDGSLYRWGGSFPKDVPSGSTPQSTGGFGLSAWVEVSDAALRQDLTANDGYKIVGGLSNFTNHVYISATDFAPIQAAQDTYKGTNKTIVYTSPIQLDSKLMIHCSTIFADSVTIKNGIDIVSEDRQELTLSSNEGLREFSDRVPQFAQYVGQVIRLESNHQLVERWNNGQLQHYTKNTSFLVLSDGHITPSLDMSFDSVSGVTATTTDLNSLLPLTVEFKGAVTHETAGAVIRIYRSKTTLIGSSVGFKSNNPETSIAILADFVTVKKVRADLFTTVGTGYGVTIGNCYGAKVVDCISPMSNSTIDGRHGCGVTIEGCVSGKIGTHWGNDTKIINSKAYYIHYAGKDMSVIGGELLGYQAYGDNAFCIAHRADTPVTMGELLVDGVKLGSAAKVLLRFILLKDDPATKPRRIFDNINVRNIDLNKVETAIAIVDVTADAARFGNPTTISLDRMIVRGGNPLLNLANAEDSGVANDIAVTNCLDYTAGGALWLQSVYGQNNILFDRVTSVNGGAGIYMQINSNAKATVRNCKIASMMVRNSTDKAFVEFVNCDVSMSSTGMPRAPFNGNKLIIGLMGCTLSNAAPNANREIAYAVSNVLKSGAMEVNHLNYFSSDYVQPAG